MTDEERHRILSGVEMDSINLVIALRRIADAWDAFISRVRGTRPSECEEFIERWEALCERASAEAQRLADAIFEANVGITNDGPDRWTADLDRLHYERTKGK